MIKKQLIRRIQTFFGVGFVVLIVIGAFVGAELAKQNQDTRQQASGGALPTSDNNILNVCVIIESNGKVLEEWDMVPETKFKIKAGPVSTSYSPEQNTLPSDYQSKLEDITINSKDLTNATLENGQNARCHRIGTASPTHLYLEGSIESSGQWDGVKYNDVFNKDVTRYHDYDKSIFDDNPGNDATRNKDADGHISISGRTDRKLVLFAKLNSPLNTPSPTPSPTALPTPTPTLAPTSSPVPKVTATATPVGAFQANTIEPTPTISTQRLSTTVTPSPTPTNTPTIATGGTQNTPAPTSTPTSTPTPQSFSTQQLPTATPTPVLLALGNTPTPTAASITTHSGTGGTTITPTPTSSSLTTTTLTATPTTTIPTTTTARTQKIDQSDIPVSGAIENTLALIIFGGTLFSIGFWLLKK